MSIQRIREIGPRTEKAIGELRGLIQQRYPDAQFRVESSPDDPDIIHLIAIVDVIDSDEIMDLVIDRMMKIQIDENLPVYVIPIRPAARVKVMRAGVKSD